MKTNRPYLSVIVPVYNEVTRLQNLHTIDKYLKKQKFLSELVVVNDGSTDGTYQMLKEYANTIELQVISYKKRQGKGYAIKQGMINATGKFILFTDIDLSVPISMCTKFLEHVQMSPVVIGSRKIKKAIILTHQSYTREQMGKVFTLLSQTILQLNVSDFTCGFKCFQSNTAKNIFSRSKLKGWGFDSEILFIANKYGYGIEEVPVVWKNDTNTRVKFPQDIIMPLLELIQIHINNMTKKY